MYRSDSGGKLAICCIVQPKFLAMTSFGTCEKKSVSWNVASSE